MARRRRQSNGEALILGLGQFLPWWVCLILALLAYLLLHGVASRPLPPPDPKQLGGFMTGIVFRSWATVLQYVVPIALAAAAVVSLTVRGQRRDLAESATGSNAAAAIAGMSWQQFETLIAEGFRLQGYEVTERRQGGADGGVDLRLRRGSETFLVQAKHWKAFKVGVEVVRELYGLMAAEGAAGGFVVTSGRFTDDAKAFADGRNVRLVDGSRLAGLFQQVRSGEAIYERSSGISSTPVPARPSSKIEEALTPTETPACPSCSRLMVRRVAKRGASAGRAFGGCAGTPSCRGTRPIVQASS